MAEPRDPWNRSSGDPLPPGPAADDPLAGNPLADAPRLVVEVVRPEQLAATAAAHLADSLRAALAERPRATIALSGGSTVPPVLAELVRADLDWQRVVILQADERIAPDGHPDRNLPDLLACLADSPAAAADVRPMPAADLDAGRSDAEAATAAYADELAAVAGDPVVLDVVQLGLGADGHTASLLPGDAPLELTERPVAVSREHEGRRRMTLTLPVLDAARARVWVVAGEHKRDALARLVAGDLSIPAGLVHRDALVIADRPAAGGASA